jgi:Tol biopolymer transport system component
VVSRPTVLEVGDSTLIHVGIATGHFPDWCRVAHKTPEIVYSGSTEGWVFGLMLTTPIYDIHYPLTREPGDTMPAWSPDCTRIAFAREEDGNWDIYVINPDSSGRRRLTSDGAIEFAPVWSPTGDLIAFLSNRDGRWAIWVINPSGQNLRNLIEVEDRTHTFSDQLDPCIDWAP